MIWRDRALCAETDPDAFFPEGGGSARAPKLVCLACEVRTECLAYAMRNPHLAGFGVWGGLTAQERRQLRRHGEAEAA